MDRGSRGSRAPSRRVRPARVSTPRSVPGSSRCSRSRSAARSSVVRYIAAASCSVSPRGSSTNDVMLSGGTTVGHAGGGRTTGSGRIHESARMATQTTASASDPRSPSRCEPRKRERRRRRQRQNRGHREPRGHPDAVAEHAESHQPRVRWLVEKLLAKEPRTRAEGEHEQDDSREHEEGENRLPTKRAAHRTVRRQSRPASRESPAKRA